MGPTHGLRSASAGRRWTGMGLLLALGMGSGTARAADPADHARIRYLWASGRPEEAAAESAALLRASPEDPELVVLHVLARSALGEGPYLVDAVGEGAPPTAALARAVAWLEGVADASAHCLELDALLSEPPQVAVQGALSPVWDRLDAVCPELQSTQQALRRQLEDAPEALRAQLPRADASWGQAVQEWAQADPPDLTRAGNPWAEGVEGAGVVRAQVALRAAADRALASDEPARLWWAREVVLWQGGATDAYDRRLAELSPGLAPVQWETDGRARWQVVTPRTPASVRYQLEEVAGLRAPDRRLRALRDLGPLLLPSGPTRARWWALVAACHEQLGHPRRSVLAHEHAWKAQPDQLDRANAFAWAAATHRIRMDEALVAIDSALASPMPYRADRGGPEADRAHRWNGGHSVGAALDTRGWLRFQLGDLAGARADLDRALMLYRSPSATVHFHAAIVAHADGAEEVALFHVKRGFAVLSPTLDAPELVARARELAETLYDARRWHPGGMDAWLASVVLPEASPSGGPMVDLDAVAERLGAEPPGLPVEGGPAPELLMSVAGTPTFLHEVEGWKVVELWAAWCMNCHLQMGALQALHAEWMELGIPASVVVVSVEDMERAEWPDALVGTPGEGWVIGWGGTGVMDQLGASGLPATLVVDPHGRVVETRLGWEGDLQWLRETLAEAGVWPADAAPAGD